MRPEKATVCRTPPSDHRAYGNPTSFLPTCSDILSSRNGAAVACSKSKSFEGTIWDPCCGWGCIVQAANDIGRWTYGSDIVDRGAAEKVKGGLVWFQNDFLRAPSANSHAAVVIKGITRFPFSIVANPPFNRLQEFVARALGLGAGKIAFIWRLQRLAAARWLRDVPLARIYLMTPRPSMPPGSHIEAGGFVGGDFTITAG